MNLLKSRERGMRFGALARITRTWVSVFRGLETSLILAVLDCVKLEHEARGLNIKTRNRSELVGVLPFLLPNKTTSTKHLN